MIAAALALLVAASSPATADRRPAPDFELKDLAGKRVRLSGQKGKVVIVNFWATWCAPCLRELPHLDKLQRARGKDGLVVYAITTDGPQTQSQVRSLVKRERFDMPVLLDPEGRAFAALNPRGTNPFTLAIDREGRIAETHEGYNPGDERMYEEWAARLLAE